MSRKDTIIIAVLINAGLLIVLFASALKSTPPGQEIAAAAAIPRTAEPILKKEYPAHSVDEVDQALQRVNPLSPIAPVAQAPVTYTASVPQLSTSQAVNFTDDLKSFTIPDPSPSYAFSPPVAAAPLEEKKSVEYAEIKVKKGDVLEKIARQHRTSVDAIIAYNQLSSTNLRIGQMLKIPKKNLAGPSSPLQTASTVADLSDGHKYYVVKNGDNPWTIAVKNHMKLEELLKLNNLDQEKARKLKPGDKLLIQ